MDLKSTYNRIAKDWMQDHHSDTWWVEGTDKYLSFLNANASVLDVGCGAGVKSKYITSKGFHVTGVDFSEEMVAFAQADVSTGSFAVKDIKQSLGFEQEFDGVFAQAVLLHIPKKEVAEVLKNITDPLKVGGYFYLAVKELRPGKPDEEIVKENDYGYDYERFFSYFTLDEIKNYLRELGVEVVYENVSTSGKTNWIQLIAKKITSPK